MPLPTTEIPEFVTPEDRQKVILYLPKTTAGILIAYAKMKKSPDPNYVIAHYAREVLAKDPAYIDYISTNPNAAHVEKAAAKQRNSRDKGRRQPNASEKGAA